MEVMSQESQMKTKIYIYIYDMIHIIIYNIYHNIVHPVQFLITNTSREIIVGLLFPGWYYQPFFSQQFLLLESSPISQSSIKISLPSKNPAFFSPLEKQFFRWVRENSALAVLRTTLKANSFCDYLCSNILSSRIWPEWLNIIKKYNSG